MKMEQVNGKYEKVLEILKRTEPQLGSTGQIEENVLNRISANQKREIDLSDIVDFLFGWTYVTWVRRSLMAASAFLVVMFVFQQSMIMTQINHLSRQIELYKGDATGMPGNYAERKMLILRFPDKRFPIFNKGNTEQHVEELFRTIEQLKMEYKELDNMIKNDPELKKLIENKLSEINGTRIKI